MAQVPPTVVAHNLRPVTIGIGALAYGSRDRIPEGGPATPGIEFGVGVVERRFAASAEVGPGLRVVLVVFVGVRTLGAFLAEDAEFVCYALATRTATGEMVRNVLEIGIEEVGKARTG
jgi:hypothetical protein